MPDIADLQRDFVNAVRELAVGRNLRKGVAVRKERGTVCRVVVPVESSGTTCNDVAVQ